MTDADGRYELGQLAPGAYVVSAGLLDGYLGLAYGQQQPRLLDTGTPIAVGVGQTVEDVDIALPRAGAILVRLTDATGEPIAGAHVQILRFEYRPDGRQQLTSVPTGIRGPARTDDRGEIRVFGLMPGEYAIGATAPTLVPASARVASDRTEGFSRTYYPGTTSAAEARLVTLGTSEERTVEFAMVASPLHRITGSVAMSDGRPAAGLDLQLAPAEGESGTVSGAGTVAADGTFAVAGVPGGTYMLRVRQNMRPSIEDLRAGRAPSPFAAARGEFASLPVTVSGEDVTGLRIITGRGTTISGRVTLEGGSTPPATGELRVLALPPGLAGGGFFVLGGSVYDFPPDSGVAMDGSFRIAGASGRVQLDVPTANLMVTSVTVDGRDVTDEALELDRTDSVSGVVVTMTDRVTAVTGQVRDRDGQPVHGAVVVVLPADPAGATGIPRPIHTSRSNAGGRFEIRRVRPGRYVAAAVEWIEPGRQFAPDFQQQLRRGARALTLGEGETQTLDLTLSPAP